MTTKPPLRVLISGAGIAGPCLAFWLTRLPVPVTITLIERHHNLRASGQQIDLRGAGLDVMRKMGIEPAVRAIIVDEPGILLVDPAGRRQAYFPSNKTGQGISTATAEFELMRGDLVDVLHTATKDHPGVTYRFGLSVDSFVQDEKEKTVRVRLSDGTEGVYDLLVGADGLGSRVRRRMWGVDEDKKHVHPMHIGMGLFSIPPEEGDERAGCVMHLPGRRMVFTRRDSPTCLRVGLCQGASHEELERLRLVGTPEQQRRAWADRFEDARSCWRMDRILKGLLESEMAAGDFYAVNLAKVKLESYSKGCVTLLGDAAYCPSPMSGMGTSLAFIGAYVLAGEIGQALCDEDKDFGGGGYGARVAGALEGYDRAMKPIVELVHQRSPDKASWQVPQSRFGIRVLHWVVWSLATMLSRLAWLADWFDLTGEKKGRNSVPVYEVLKERKTTEQ